MASEADADAEFCVVPEAEDAPHENGGSSGFPFGAGFTMQGGQYMTLRSANVPAGANLTPKKPRRVYTALKKLWLDELLLMKTIRCPVPACNGRFKSLYNMQIHYEHCKGVNNSGILQCPLCGEAFYSLSNALEIHFTEAHPHEKITPGQEKTSVKTPQHPATELFLKQQPPETRSLKKRDAPPRKSVRFQEPKPSEEESIDLPAPVSQPPERRQELISNRRRTYSRSLNEPVGPSSEIIRMPTRNATFDEEDALQLPQFMLEMDINLPEGGVKPKKRRYVNDYAPEVNNVDTTGMPEVEQLPPPISLEKVIRPPKRRRRQAKHEVKIVQVLVRSQDTQSTSILSNSKLVNAIVGQALKLTSDPTKQPSAPPIVVALNKTSTQGDEYVPPSVMPPPNVIRRSANRMNNVAIQSPQNPAPQPDFDAVFQSSHLPIMSGGQSATVVPTEGLTPSDGAFIARGPQERSVELLPPTGSSSYSSAQDYGESSYAQGSGLFAPISQPSSSAQQGVDLFQDTNRQYYGQEKMYMADPSSIVYSTDGNSMYVPTTSAYMSYQNQSDIDLKPCTTAQSDYCMTLSTSRTDVGIQAGSMTPDHMSMTPQHISNGNDLEAGDLQIIEATPEEQVPGGGVSGEQRTLYLVDSGHEGGGTDQEGVYIFEVRNDSQPCGDGGEVFIVSQDGTQTQIQTGPNGDLPRQLVLTGPPNDALDKGQVQFLPFSDSVNQQSMTLLTSAQEQQQQPHDLQSDQTNCNVVVSSVFEPMSSISSLTMSSQPATCTVVSTHSSEYGASQTDNSLVTLRNNVAVNADQTQLYSQVPSEIRGNQVNESVCVSAANDGIRPGSLPQNVHATDVSEQHFVEIAAEEQVLQQSVQDMAQVGEAVVKSEQNDQNVITVHDTSLQFGHSQINAVTVPQEISSGTVTLSDGQVLTNQMLSTTVQSSASDVVTEQVVSNSSHMVVETDESLTSNFSVVDCQESAHNVQLEDGHVTSFSGDDVSTVQTSLCGEEFVKIPSPAEPEPRNDLSIVEYSESSEGDEGKDLNTTDSIPEQLCDAGEDQPSSDQVSDFIAVPVVDEEASSSIQKADAIDPVSNTSVTENDGNTSVDMEESVVNNSEADVMTVVKETILEHTVSVTEDSGIVDQESFDTPELIAQDNTANGGSSEEFQLSSEQESGEISSEVEVSVAEMVSVTESTCSPRAEDAIKTAGEVVQDLCDKLGSSEGSSENKSESLSCVSQSALKC